MNWPVALIVFAVMLAAEELYSVLSGRPTLSRKVWQWSHQYPVVAFLMGVVVGILMWHFFVCNNAFYGPPPV